MFQVNVETVNLCMKKSAGLAKKILMEAIPRIAAINWDPICDRYKVNFYLLLLYTAVLLRPPERRPAYFTAVLFLFLVLLTCKSTTLPSAWPRQKYRPTRYRDLAAIEDFTQKFDRFVS